MLDVQGHGCDAQGYGGSDGDPDGICWPLPGTLAPVPWASAPTAQCLIEMRDAATGELMWFDPRKILADVVARLRADGLHPTVACELEFYLIDPKRTADGGIRPAPLARTGEVPRTALNLGMSAVEDYSEFILAVAAAAEAGVPASTAVAEYGLGQFEINLRHVSDPVLAADHAILLKRIIQGVARARGLDATFMAKPFIDQPGNGMHVHVSMADETGRNIFAGAEASRGSTTASPASRPRSRNRWRSSPPTSRPSAATSRRCSCRSPATGRTTTARSPSAFRSATVRRAASSTASPARMRARTWCWRRSSPASTTA